MMNERLAAINTFSKSLLADADVAVREVAEVSKEMNDLTARTEQELRNLRKQFKRTRNVEYVNSIRERHAKCSLGVTESTGRTLELWRSYDSASMKETTIEVGNLLRDAGDKAVAVPEDRIRLFVSMDRFAFSPPNQVYALSILAMWMASVVSVKHMTYKVFLGEPFSSEALKTVASRLGKAVVSDLIGIVYPATGTTKELYDLAKEWRYPKILSHPSTASDMDRLDQLAENLDILAQELKDESGIVRRAEKAFVEAQNDFSMALADIRAILGQYI